MAGVNNKRMKIIKGEKYIYLAMAYALAKSHGGVAIVGHDSGYRGGFMYWRRFTIHEYQGKTLLTETKSSRHCADFSRTFEVVDTGGDRPIIRDYYNEAGENCATRWIH